MTFHGRTVLMVGLALAALLAVSCKKKSPDTEPAGQAREAQASEEKPGAEAAQEAPAEQPKAWAPFPLGRPSPLGKQPKGAMQLYRKGSVAMTKGDAAAARPDIEASVKEDPFFDVALWKLAQLDAKEGKQQETLDVLERLLAFNYVRYAPLIMKTGWLKDLRNAEEAWGPFEEKMEAYRKAWSEALRGPGVFFIQGRFRKIEATDLSGEPLDLTFARGTPMFWSKALKRFMPVGGSGEAAGFLFDRARARLYLVEWAPHPESLPGALGKISLTCLDLEKLELVGKPIVPAAEAEAVRAALDEDGRLLIEVVAPEKPSGTAPALAPGIKKAVSKALAAQPVGEAAEEEPPAEEEAEGEGEAAGEPPAAAEELEEGETLVKAVDFEKGQLVDAEAGNDEAWALVLMLGSTAGPPPASAEGIEDKLPKAARGGACVWVEEGSSVCIEPTKKGGRWYTISLREGGGEKIVLNAEYIAIVQY
jgi:hypothetical protein